MDTEETAALIGNTPGTLAAWRHTRIYDLPFVKCGALVRYRLSDVNAWLARRTMNLPKGQSPQAASGDRSRRAVNRGASLRRGRKSGELIA